jgi:hypothetical protein
MLFGKAGTSVKFTVNRNGTEIPITVNRGSRVQSAS